MDSWRLRLEVEDFLDFFFVVDLDDDNDGIIKIDSVNGLKSYKGTVAWVASEAEFTPKIIQTKDERVALAYAIKINVQNDGGLIIGMPAKVVKTLSNDEVEAIKLNFKSYVQKGKEFLEGIEKRESQLTGISSLKISFANLYPIMCR